MKITKNNSWLFAAYVALVVTWMGCGFKSDQVDLIVHNGVI
jgi:hypothetical protein